ncbi:MAG: hypothetical protein ACK5KN_13210 [Dysgonomonas sp.]|jgi:hypothetical protein|uniref:hypothetical protein n=1 Tax=Dysgonomonas sp. TaxID=1891233 RepID=UPI002831B10E|nr:hypothetical protein [Prevotella sp.]MDR2002522.1 hypothetical protein [Prevotella sp.]
MANETRKLDPVELSSLKTIEDPKGFYIFGSIEENGVMKSGKCKFDTLDRLQVERRISLTMETTAMEMFIGEEMTIYKVDALNVKSLTIDDETFTNLNNIQLDKKIEKRSKVRFMIETQTTDPTAYLFIYAKAILP